MTLVLQLFTNHVGIPLRKIFVDLQLHIKTYFVFQIFSVFQSYENLRNANFHMYKFHFTDTSGYKMCCIVGFTTGVDLHVECTPLNTKQCLQVICLEIMQARI